MEESYDRGYREGVLCFGRHGILPPQSSGCVVGSAEAREFWRGYEAGWADAQASAEARRNATPQELTPLQK